MGSDWTQVKVGEICEVYDGPHATPDRTVEGPIFLGISSLNAGRIDLEQSDHVSEEDFSQWTRRVVPRGGDVVFSYETRLGEAGLIPEGLRCCLGRRMGLLRVKDQTRVDPTFLLYNYLGPSYQALLSERTVFGSTVERIPLKEVPNFPMTLPPIEEQKSIAHILGTLDDKIELNRKTNETLEGIAKALFKSWFVDFDPVRAKAEGRPTGLPDEISELFPDSFGDSELGEIPSGWQWTYLNEIAINPRDTAKPGEMTPSDRYVGLEHMPRGSICLGEYGVAENLESNKNRFLKGDLLYGKLRPYFKKTGSALFDGVCSTDIVVIRAKQECLKGFTCCLLASDPFIDFTVAASSGTRMPRTSWKDMSEFPFCLPEKSLLELFESLFSPQIQRIQFGSNQNKTLSAVHDALLPRLISGELRVPDAEKMLEEVGI